MFAGLAIGAIPAHAAFIGSQLHWDYYAYGGLYQTGNTWTVAGSGGTFLTYFTMWADATSITFDYSTGAGGGSWSTSALSLAPKIANGIAINLVSGGPFTSVSIDGATNMVGFSASRISFTGSQIQVDWQNLPFDQRTIVKLNVNATGGQMPEPAQTSTVALSLAALAFWQRKRILAR